MVPLIFQLSKKLFRVLRLQSLWSELAHYYLWRTHSLESLDKNGKAFLQIVGLPRSGTTLLTCMIDMHTDVLCLSEPYRQWFFSGKVKVDGLEHWVHDGVWRRHPFKLLQTLFYQNDLKYIGLKETFFDEEHGSLQNDFFFKDNIRSGATDHTIAIVRDPRDIWISVRTYMHRVLGEEKGSEWSSVTQRLVNNWNHFGAWVLDMPLFYLHYEDLVTEPEQQLRRVAAYLGLPFQEGMLTANAKEGMGDPRALAGGAVNTRSVARFREQLGEADRAFIEARCGHLLDEFGYQRTI